MDGSYSFKFEKINHVIMLTLFFFLGTVIHYLGEVYFFVIYIVSLVAGNLLSLFFNKNNYNYSAIGASGAVMGVLYSAILFEPWMKINFIIPGFVYGIGYMLYSIYGMKNKADNIGHDAHFGGSIGGYAATLMLYPSLLVTDLPMVGLLSLPIVVLFVMKQMGKL